MFDRALERITSLVGLSLLVTLTSCSEIPTHAERTEGDAGQIGDTGSTSSQGSSSSSGSSNWDEELLESTVVGLPASFIGVAVRGVTGGGVAWVVAEGEIELDREDGELEVEVEGLLITGTGTAADGTTGSVTDVAASLTCEGAGVVATTGLFPLSAAGDAEIEDEITIPSSCVGPIILIRANSATGPWIAVSGF